MKVQEYVTTEDFNYSSVDDASRRFLIPAGTFVKPIYHYNLPAHIRGSKMYFWWNPTKDTFVYCHYGILIIPKDIIREV